MRLSSILDPSCVVVDVGAGSRFDALARLAACIGRVRPDLDAEALLVELERREQESSTAIADGIAIPHARPDCRDVVSAAIGVLPAGLDMGSLDGKPTTILVVLVSPASNPEQHGKWLGHIARVLSDADTRRRLLGAASAGEILEILDRREDQFLPAEAGGDAPGEPPR